jgi:hypothetical protein
MIKPGDQQFSGSNVCQIDESVSTRTLDGGLINNLGHLLPSLDYHCFTDISTLTSFTQLPHEGQPSSSAHAASASAPPFQLGVGT